MYGLRCYVTYHYLVLLFLSEAQHTVRLCIVHRIHTSSLHKLHQVSSQNQFCKFHHPEALEEVMETEQAMDRSGNHIPQRIHLYILERIVFRLRSLSESTCWVG